MTNKIAVLRGINVGGKRRILMADLKLIFRELGCTDVATYIQSGNVIFKSQAESQELENRIAKAITETFGFDVPVIVRTSEELSESATRNPFYKTDTDINKLHLTFLKEKPSEENREHAETYIYEPDKFIIDRKDVFIFCEGKYHKTKLTNNFFEKKLKVGATTRNWKTVMKLIELSKN